MTTGRRAGASTAKADILEAARELFAEVGFDRATVRAIAARANVDVALVSYYYENKAGLLRAAMELPLDPRKFILEAVQGPREDLGERLLRGAFRAWESPEAGAGVRAALRAAAVDTVGNHSTLGEFVSSEMIPTVMSVTGIPKESARVLASTVLGLAFMRYLVRAPAFTEASVDELIASYAPVIQGIVDADAHPARS